MPADVRIEYLADHSQCVDQLARWHHAQWSYLNPARSLEERKNELARHNAPRQVPTTFVALQNGEPLGSASLVEHDLKRRTDLTPWLASVYVAPDYREQGLGSALVARVVEEAQALGFGTLYLFTTDRESFYGRRGWVTFEQSDCNGASIVLMSKALANRLVG
jgi:predicted N-acetyltransferase YhbS